MDTPIPFVGDPFVRSLPTPQNAVDLFRDWASAFPAASPVRSPGTTRLFEDSRIRWLEQGLRELRQGGLEGMQVLELGPLEGGHTYMLDRAGAARIDAIEANAIAYLKCLVVKETFGIPSASFHLGDVVSFVENSSAFYDLTVCSGVLYHLQDPVGFLRALSLRTRHLFVWCNTFSEEIFVKKPELKGSFGAPKVVREGDLSYELHPHYYGDVSDYSAFWGGVAPSSAWMRAGDVIAVLESLGFVINNHLVEDHAFGEQLTLLATRPGAPSVV